MRLENSFTVPTSPERTWDILLDVPAIADCVPGARLTEVAGENAYKGEATVKVGPVSLTFAGEAKIVETDAAARRAKVEARGADKRGRGNARADVVFALSPQDGSTRVDVSTDLQLSGTVAQYGRGKGLMEAIAAEILNDFARNLEARINAGGEGEAPATGETSPAGAAQPDEPRRGQESVAAAGGSATPSGQSSLSAFGLFWRVLKSWFRAKTGGRHG